MKKVLTIAGTDCSGGAGVQADLKTMSAHNVYGMSAICALTAQNTTGVYGIMDVSEEFLANQLDCIFTDIYPDAIKIGMVSNKGLIKVIANKLLQYEAKNIVVDPVMVSTSGSRLLNEDASDSLIKELIPLADIITPNLAEAEVLSGINIKTREDMIKAGELIAKNCRGAVLVKGGHLDDTADDMLYSNGVVTWLRGERINNDNTHGTGCTLSSAIACNLASGCELNEAVKEAKDYLTGALKYGLNLGKGSGPLNHCYRTM